MSTKERAQIILDNFTEEQLEEFIAMYSETPNAETIAAFNELDNGGGTLFKGAPSELFKELSGD